MILISLIVPGLYFMAETYGLKLSSATNIAMIIATIPIFAAVFAFILIKEKINIRAVVGIVLSVLGVGIILSAAPGRNFGMQMVQVGNLLGLGAALCAGVYMALGRDLLRRYSPLALTTFQALSASALFLPLAVLEMVTHSWKGLDPLTLAAILYLAFFCSVLAFFLWNYGISRIEAGRAAVFTNLSPVFTILGSYFLIKEKIHPGQILGVALVIFGVTLAGIARGRVRIPG